MENPRTARAEMIRKAAGSISRPDVSRQPYCFFDAQQVLSAVLIRIDFEDSLGCLLDEVPVPQPDGGEGLQIEKPGILVLKPGKAKRS